MKMRRMNGIVMRTGRVLMSRPEGRTRPVNEKLEEEESYGENDDREREQE